MAAQWCQALTCNGVICANDGAPVERSCWYGGVRCCACCANMRPDTEGTVCVDCCSTRQFAVSDAQRRRRMAQEKSPYTKIDYHCWACGTDAADGGDFGTAAVVDNGSPRRQRRSRGRKLPPEQTLVAETVVCCRKVAPNVFTFAQLSCCLFDPSSKQICCGFATTMFGVPAAAETQQ